VGGYSNGAGLAPGAIMDEFRVYSRALTAAEITATWNLQVGGGSTILYQTNQPAADMNVDGAQGTATSPAIANVTTNSLVGLNLNSTVSGMPWDLAYGLSPLVSSNSTAVTTLGGQILNIDLADPSWGTWFNLFSSSPPFSNMTLPLSFSAPLSVSVQFAVLDPTSGDGFVLSQPTRVIAQ
ncbi:MAG: hypothetical protein CMJ83_15475, partial [Planctomycetes bacterium]|nr:hypothetical protein [Planctomycetota bacterium]